MLKDAQHHPVRGETTHVDFLRVDLSKPIEAIVTIELVGADDAPGIRDGGVLDQSLREVNVEALPNEIPEMLTLDVSELNIGDTLPLSAVVIPSGVTLLDDPETVAASLLAPRLRTDEEEGIEEETELVGEGDVRRRRRRLRRLRGLAPPRRAQPVRRDRAGRLAHRRPGQPGPRSTSARRTTSGSRSSRSSRDRWDLGKPKKKFGGLLAEGRAGIGGPRVALLQPLTYMNESGTLRGPGARRASRSTSTACSSCTTRSTCRSATSARGSAAGSPGTTG